MTFEDVAKLVDWKIIKTGLQLLLLLGALEPALIPEIPIPYKGHPPKPPFCWADTRFKLVVDWDTLHIRAPVRPLIHLLAYRRTP